MTGPKFDPNDPRLTAYVAGELDDEARLEVELLLESSQEARAIVNDLGDLAAHLEQGLAAELFEPLSDESRRRVRAAAADPANTFAPVTEPVRDVQTPTRTGSFAVLAALVSVVAVCLVAVSIPVGTAVRPSNSTVVDHRIDLRGHGMASFSNTTATNGSSRHGDFGEPRAHIVSGLAGSEEAPPTDWMDTDFSTHLAWRDFYDFDPGWKRWWRSTDEADRFGRPGDPVVEAPVTWGVSRFSVVDNYTAPWRGRFPAQGLAGGFQPQTEFDVDVLESRADGGLANEPSSAYGLPQAIQSEALARNNLALVDETNRRYGVYKRLAEEREKYRFVADDTARERVRELHEKLVEERREIERLQVKIAEVQRAQQVLGPGNENQAPVGVPAAENVFLSPVENPVSSFPVRVETWPYASTRELVRNGDLPDPSSVPIECYVNAFRYASAAQAAKEVVAVTLEAGPCPWNDEHRLVRVALEAKDPETERGRPANNFVFLVDVAEQEKANEQIPLVQQGLTLVKDRLDAQDQFAIVNNDTNPRVLVERASGKDEQRIRGAIDGIQTSRADATAPAALAAAYENGWSQYVEKGLNDVVLCTDGTNFKKAGAIQRIEELARRQSARGLNLNVVQVGGDKNGDLAELAQSGNGLWSYVEQPRDVHDVFVDGLLTRGPVVAEDVDVQVEFNPARVQSYRLVGFDDPLHDALTPHDPPPNDLIAGGRVTVLYEVRPQAEQAAGNKGRPVLRYQQQAPAEEDPVQRESLSLRLSYRTPTEEEMIEREFTLVDDGTKAMPSPDFQWAAAVAEYGLVLRDSAFKGTANLDKAAALANGARGPDPTGERREFVELVHRTKAVQSGTTPPSTSPLGEQEALVKATMNGRYDNLLRTVEVQEEYQPPSKVVDYGWWEGTSYAGQHDLPKAYWVYVQPNWYLWGQRKDEPAEKATVPPPNASDR